MTQPTLLCLASYFKGADFLTAAHDAGARVLLVTDERYAREAWPREHIDLFFPMAETTNVDYVTNGVSYLARTELIDRIVPLDDYDVLTAAALREHLRLPGMGQSRARIFRDKLAMRLQAYKCGLRVPPFVGVFNYEHLRVFFDQVPGPWLLKPRTEAGAMGIRRVSHADELWPLLDELGDEQSHFLLERFLPGAVYHVDSLTYKGKLLFASVQKYGQPPLEVAHDGGVFVSRVMPRDDPDRAALLELNRRFIDGFGMVNGINHTEFIKAEADGEFYFLETAARVGGANVADMIEAATGINLWHEWARLETALAKGQPYVLPPTRDNYAGILVCLAHQQQPDLSAYADKEVVWRMARPYHAGLIVASPDSDRIDALLGAYGPRFVADFLTSAPPLDRAP
jgi:biotin carboxylase